MEIARRFAKAISIGNAAFDALKNGDGKVHSVFERTFNVLFGDELVGIGRRDVARSPINLVTDIASSESMSSLGISKDMQVEVDDRLLIGGMLEISLEGAMIWQPRDHVDGHPNFDHVKKNLKILEKFIAENRRREGLGELLSHTDEIAVGKISSTSNFNDVAKVVLPNLVNLFRAIESENVNDIGKISGNLIGLGPGLSPSGDDALIGLMVALWWTTNSLGGDIERVRKINETIITHANKTTLLSKQLLRHAARGETNEIVEALFDGIFVGEPEDVIAGARKVLRIGETSGVDMMVGLLLGLRVGLNFI
jgi:hypothetical protein